MELSDVWGVRINALVNSTVSQSIDCADGEFFDWDTLDLVAAQHNINWEQDGCAILLAAAAQLATVICIYAEEAGVDPADMHAEFVRGMENNGPSSA